LSLILYSRETSSLNLREEHILRVPENKVLGDVFGPKRGKVSPSEEFQ